MYLLIFVQHVNRTSTKINPFQLYLHANHVTQVKNLRQLLLLVQDVQLDCLQKKVQVVVNFAAKVKNLQQQLQFAKLVPLVYTKTKMIQNLQRARNVAKEKNLLLLQHFVLLAKKASITIKIIWRLLLVNIVLKVKNLRVLLLHVNLVLKVDSRELMIIRRRYVKRVERAKLPSVKVVVANCVNRVDFKVQMFQ